MFIGICQIDFRDVCTQSTSESTHSACAWFLFSPEDNDLFIFRDEINSDQTLLKFSFNSALQDDSSEKIPVSQGVADG